MMLRLLCFSALIPLLISHRAFGYEPTVTHPNLSKEALNRSQLKLDATLLPRLGLKPFAANETFGAQAGIEPPTILQRLIDGVTAEDVGARAINHFYDPYFDRAYSIPVVGELGKKSPDWSLEDRGNISEQLESLKDARESMFDAITFNSAAQSVGTRALVRKQLWGQTFERLGHVLHHIQDMAQPQHTRNDSHLDEYRAFGLNPIYNPSIYERYSSARGTGRDSVETAARSAGAAIFPGSIEFTTPRDFWKNSSGTGMAEFANRNFVSQGTNFAIFYGAVLASKYPLPIPGTPQSYSIDVLFGGPTKVPVPIKALCSDQGLDCKMTMYPTITTAKASTLSIFDQDLEPNDKRLTFNDGYLIPSYTVSRLFALNRFNFDAAHETLIPKTVSYSAGLINFFFRGQMEITPPEEGVYSIVDHFDFSGQGQPPIAPASGFKGFKTIKLKLRNSTPDIGSAAQIMPGGTLVAVLKFYRNLAYTDDLAGEPVNSAAYTTNRSTAEEIVVSTSVKDASGNPLTAPIPVTNSLQTLIFEFGQELPINATDVKLQVVYRGVLGSETDAVVVQTVDISEPSYFTFMNASDYIRIGTSDIGIPNSVYTRAEINATEINATNALGSILRNRVQPTSCIDQMTDQLKDTAACHQPFRINFPIKLGNSAAAVATIDLTSAKTYHRLAVLAPPEAEGIVSINQSASPCLPKDPITFAGKVIQTNYIPDSSPAGYKVVTSASYAPPIRGVYGWHTIACVNNGDNSTPGAGDDRNTKMTALPPANLKPLKMVGFQFP